MEANRKRTKRSGSALRSRGIGRALNDCELASATGGLSSKDYLHASDKPANMVTCPECGKQYDYDTFYHCPNCVKMKNKRVSL